VFVFLGGLEAAQKVVVASKKTRQSHEYRHSPAASSVCRIRNWGMARKACHISIGDGAILGRRESGGMAVAAGVITEESGHGSENRSNLPGMEIRAVDLEDLAERKMARIGRLGAVGPRCLNRSE
jgi:hypothetical protein